MSEQNKRAKRREQEDAAFNKMLLWLAGCAVLEALTMLFRQFYIHFPIKLVHVVMGMCRFFGVFRFVGPVLTAAAAVWTVMCVRKGGRGKQLAAPLACTGVLLWLTAAAILCANYAFGLDMGATLLCAVPAVIAALAVVFFLYQQEFFYCSAMCAAGIVAIWVYRTVYNNHPKVIYVGFAAVWLLLAAAAALAYVARTHDGVLFGIRVLPTNAGYAAPLLTALVTAALMALTMALGLNYALYVMFVLIGWLFCLAVYYTVKLM